jgi:hypothetical protein
VSGQSPRSPSEPLPSRPASGCGPRTAATVRKRTTAPMQIGVCLSLTPAYPRPLPSHSIILSARASTEGGMLSLSALAVFELMINSNLVGCSIGKSAGFAPFNILST